jgi:hypothetical protein
MAFYRDNFKKMLKTLRVKLANLCRSGLLKTNNFLPLLSPLFCFSTRNVSGCRPRQQPICRVTFFDFGVVELTEGSSGLVSAARPTTSTPFSILTEYETANVS